MFIILFVFHFEISGNLVNDEHPRNILLTFLMLMVFQIEISGNSNKDEQPENI